MKIKESNLLERGRDIKRRKRQTERERLRQTDKDRERERGGGKIHGKNREGEKNSDKEGMK